jgi:peptidoglycan/xylan/chitin deacetylase (PgdA/CDA1 family)
MSSLAEDFDVLTESEVLDWLDGRRDLRRPSCWITFDDGYRDVVEHVAPILEQHAFSATMFVSTKVVMEPACWLPADLWYATLSNATRSEGTLLDGGGRWDFVLEVPQHYARLVDGPERRRYLRAPVDEQLGLLEHLARALAAPSLPKADLYVKPDGLADLVAKGWSVGGHGHAHVILTSAEKSICASEIRVPRELLETHGLSPRTFAYADGASDAEIAEKVREGGWRAAVCLGNGHASAGDRYQLRRFLAVDDPLWIRGLRAMR